MTTHIGHSLFITKKLDEDQRILEGLATTPTPDRHGDVVVLEGIQYRTPFPLLRGHNTAEPIGQVVEAQKTATGLWIRAQVAPDVAPYVAEAWAQIKAGLIRGLSIGFRVLEESFDRELNGFRFMKTELLELSAVAIPANADATILAVKAFDHPAGALPGHPPAAAGGRPHPNPPGALGLQRTTPMTIQEQIRGFEAKRTTAANRMEALMAQAAAADRTLDPAETEEYDGLSNDVHNMDEHMARLKTHERQLVARASVVPSDTAGTSGPAAVRVAASGSTVVVLNQPLPKGTAFARLAIALASQKGNRQAAAEVARQLWHDTTPEVELVLRAESLPGTTQHPTWAKPLVPAAQNLFGEFLELLRPATILGRIPGLRRVPFMTSVPAQTAGGLYGWVGEGAAKPVGQLAFSTVTLPFAKVAGIITFTKELMRFSNPAVEGVVREDMVNGTAAFLDQQFIDPAVAEVVNVSPASITNGVTAIPATGTTADAFRKDMATLLGNFTAANNSPQNAVVLMSNTQAMKLGLLTTPISSAPEFPAIGMTGGGILGFTVIASEVVGNKIIVLNARDILLADDGQVTIDVSEEASIQMSTTPGEPAGSPVSGVEMVSMFQRNEIAMRVDRFIYWKKARATSVGYISGANYGPA
jgi:HK97 family phage prohead protease